MSTDDIDLLPVMKANKKLELVFVNHTFDVWESWIVEGATLEDCRLTNSKFRGVGHSTSFKICFKAWGAVLESSFSSPRDETRPIHYIFLLIAIWAL